MENAIDEKEKLIKIDDLATGMVVNKTFKRFPYNDRNHNQEVEEKKNNEYKRKQR